MKKQKVTDIFLYRWRYVFGYTLLALLYIGAVIVSALCCVAWRFVSIRN
ncbi:hypothetical protein KOY48_02450 [Candidatus Minimicrobia naudis]|uniref:Uncharacterized protein n=1 Tax=Candidatus Minimicrobia naudis TaxID=2841263 RepID=A0A8F1MDP0_9BACT|nr:hypothetical protein KOY48_02450 [Candidatus Minimicrobia naudis]